jgi:hypothetical protein
VTIDGIWIGGWIYWPLIHTTRNYKHLNVIANLHTLQITTAPAKPFPAYCVFTSRSLATALTVDILQLHAFRFIFTASRAELNPQLTEHRLAAISHHPPSLLFTDFHFLDNSFARSEKKTPFPTVTLLL